MVRNRESRREHKASLSKFVGMNFSRATEKLRKILLFKYAKLAGDTKCYRCGKEIENVEDFSVDHKQPWLHSSPSLFWDLDNVGFSHLRCNKPDWPELCYRKIREISIKKRVVSPEGMSYCRRCREYKELSAFSKDSSRWNGVQIRCKECDHILYSRRRDAKRNR